MLHDGTTIEIEVRGSGPDLLLPVRPDPIEGPQADEMRKWGVDPALGRSLIDGLADIARVPPAGSSRPERGSSAARTNGRIRACPPTSRVSS